MCSFRRCVEWRGKSVWSYSQLISRLAIDWENRDLMGGPRQAIVRFLTRRKRDALYQARFNLKGKEAYKGLFINEDLTSMRYAVLSRAKEAPHVTRVSTNFGNIICKLQTGEQKVLRDPDDLFEVGIDNVDYSHFRLQVIT